MKLKPSLRRSRARAPGLFSSNERGAMSIIAAFGLWICTLMLGLVVFTGFMVDHAQKLRNFADAWTAAWGLQMAQLGTQTWSSSLISTGVLAQQHGLGAAPTILGDARIIYPRDASIADAYLPAYLGITVLSPLDPAVLSLAQNLMGSAGNNFTADSAVRVNQVVLSSNTFYRQRVMLMMDFSSTMRLKYEGIDGSGQPAEEALRNVAINLINESTYIYDLGVLGFSTGDDAYTYGDNSTDRPSGASDATNAGTAWQNELNKRASMESDVSSWRANGDGTNIQDALVRAANALEAAEDPTFPFQKPLMIILTDGEPNRSNNARPGTGASLDQLEQIAASDARTTVQGYWNQKNSAGYDDNIDTVIMQIQRTQTDASLGAADEQFLRNIAGRNGKQDDGNNFFQDGGDPNMLSYYMQQLPKVATCAMDDLSTVTGFKENRANLPDPNKDTMRAFLSYDQGTLNEITIDPNNIFIDNINGFNTFITNPKNAAYLTGDSGGTQTITLQPLGINVTGNSVFEQYPEVLGIHYDSTTRQVTVSPMLCAALNLPSNLNNPTLRLRLRWGYSTPSDPNIVR